MAKCKFCGGKVVTGTVWHKDCWEEQAMKIAEEICDTYCRFPEMYATREQLHERHCDSCILLQLLNMGE